MPISQSIDNLLNRARIAIDSALSSEETRDSLSEYGYTPERIQAGKTLYETALAVQQRQKAEYGDQVSATATLNQAWEAAKKSYMRSVKIARIAFKNNPGAATKLGLNGKRKENLSGWLLQARQFYTNALDSPDILAALAEYGITPAKLKAGQAEMEAVEAANLLREQEKGSAQSATKSRNAALEELEDWLTDFVAIARVALEDDPQRLEALGILERS